MNTVPSVDWESESQSKEQSRSLIKGRLQRVPSVGGLNRRDPWTLDVIAREEIARLYHSIDALRTDAGPQVIQFIGSVEGEGTSSVASGFARFIASVVEKKTLLLHCSPPAAARDGGYLVLQEELQRGSTISEVFNGADEAALVPACLVRVEASMPRFVDSQSSSDLLRQLREIFSWVIIDSSPLSLSSAGLMFSRHSDGVVLVVEADRTRRAVVQGTQEQIVKSGGKVLGVVLNKRRRYLPGWTDAATLGRGATR